MNDMGPRKSEMFKAQARLLCACLLVCGLAIYNETKYSVILSPTLEHMHVLAHTHTYITQTHTVIEEMFIFNCCGY